MKSRKPFVMRFGGGGTQPERALRYKLAAHHATDVDCKISRFLDLIFLIQDQLSNDPSGNSTCDTFFVSQYSGTPFFIFKISEETRFLICCFRFLFFGAP